MNFFSFGCFLCGKRLQIASNGICSHCYQEISKYCYCGHCGSALPYDSKTCGNCIKLKPKWDNIVFVGQYSPPLSTLIHQFKFQDQFHLDKSLARLLYLAIRNAKRTHQLKLPEVIIPVPLYRLRHWRRGYNQSLLIAKQLSYWLNIPYDDKLIIRHRNTATQRGLSGKLRKQNLMDAFFCTNENCKYRSVAIVDDVITTGATVKAVIESLKKTKIKNIQVWGIAKA